MSSKSWVLLFLAVALSSCAHEETLGDVRRDLESQDAVIRELTRKNEELVAREEVQITEIETLRAQVERYRSGGGDQGAVSALHNQVSRLESDLDRLGREIAAGMRDNVVVNEDVITPVGTDGDANSLTSSDGAFNASQRSDGLAVTISDSLLFSAGSSSLRQDGKAVLLQLCEHLRADPSKIRVEGHTDDSPVRKSIDRFPLGNLQLSGERALRVADFLMKDGGISPSRVSYAGYGDQRPLVANDSAANRARNRRVEILLLKAGQ